MPRRGRPRRLVGMPQDRRRRQRRAAVQAAAARDAAAAAEDARIAKAYVTPGHPVAYSAPGAVAKHFHIKPARAKSILEGVEGYTLHREYKQPKFYNPYYVRKRRENVQADLIDVSKISRQNDGVKFLLLLIDIFTKKVWVYPLKNKSAGTMADALESWLESLRVLPGKLVTDRGTEFTNRRVQELLAEKAVGWEYARGMMKACIAERANKSLQILLYKHLTEKETLRYVDVLPQLVETYNGRPHRTLEGLTPDQGDDADNEPEVQAIHGRRYAKLAERRPTGPLPFKVGDIVRIKTDPKTKISSSARAYAEQFKGEYFKVIRINRNMPAALYYLRSLDTDEPVEGGFYANELQRQRPDSYKIERVLDEKTVRGRRMLLVKWKYFGPRWNEWIRADAVTTVFNNA